MMKKPQTNKRRYEQVIFLLWLLVLSACKMEEITAIESVKQVQGSWRIAHATRNGTNITEKFDFTLFQITFHADGSYSIQNPLPFIVQKEGTYTLDDPQYPFRIQFKENNVADAVSSSFDYPVVAGQRNLSLTFGAGCSTNTYIYTLIKDN